MPRVTFLPGGEVCSAEAGMTILQVARAHQIALSECCGGRAICTTCRVFVEAGWENLSDIGESEFDMLELLHLSPTLRLGCQAKVFGDVAVRIPE